MKMRPRVVWHDDLEVLAEKLFATWEEQSASACDPFARTCIVVGDMATRVWLKDWFLLKRAALPGRREIFANIDFKPLLEFVNDWLFAMVGGGLRNPTAHPYSQGVLTWRINAMLKKHADDPELKVLTDYISHGTAEGMECRRYVLSVRLAQLYDDYLGSRYKMLAKWERGLRAEGGGQSSEKEGDRWQEVLYRLLEQEAPQTYVKDFEKALSPDIDAERAFENGFPRYTSVHIFDVAACPWPYLAMLQKLGSRTPVTFWNFNPSEEYWLEDPTRRDQIRELARQGQLE